MPLGAYGFFAVPYTILVYPFVFAVMPLLWQVAKNNNYVTAADVVYGRYGYRPLELAVALTGVIATMPYIALQLIGMETVIASARDQGRTPACRRIPDPGAQYLFVRSAGAGAHRRRQGYDDLYRRASPRFF